MMNFNSRSERLTYKGAVLTTECDSNKHMNVMYYINKFELAGRNMIMELGIPNTFLTKHNLGIAVLEQNIKYKNEVFEDDLLYIISKVVDYTDKVFVIQHTMYEAVTQKVSAEMKVVTVLFDKEKRKVVKLSPEIKTTLERLKFKK